MKTLRGLAYLLLAAVLFGAPARAQVQEDTSGRTPIPLGSVQFYPSYRADVSWTDNLFYDNPDFGPVETYQVSMVPSLLFELPFSSSRTRFGYAYRYRAYTEPGVDANDSDYFLLDTHLEFANGFRFDFRDDYLIGVLDTKYFDAGGAVTYRGEQVNTNVASMGIGYQSRNWEIVVNGGTNRVFFPDRTITTYYDVDGWDSGLTFRYLSSPVLRWFTEFSVSRTKLEIPEGSVQPEQENLEYRRGIDAGIEYDAGPGDQFRFRVGFPYYTYESVAPSSFRTITGQLEYVHRIPALFNATFLLLRAAYPTTFLDNNYYVDDRFAFTLDNDSAARVVLGGRVTYYWNVYPELPPPDVFGGEKRVDKTIAGEAYVGYRFGGGVTWRLFFRGETRYSTIQTFEYGVGTIGTVFDFGF